VHDRAAEIVLSVVTIENERGYLRHRARVGRQRKNRVQHLASAVLIKSCCDEGLHLLVVVSLTFGIGEGGIDRAAQSFEKQQPQQRGMVAVEVESLGSIVGRGCSGLERLIGGGLHHGLRQNSVEHSVLIAEVAIDPLLVHAGSCSDAVHPRSGESVLGKLRFGSLDEIVPGLLCSIRHAEDPTSPTPQPSSWLTYKPTRWLALTMALLTNSTHPSASVAFAPTVRTVLTVCLASLVVVGQLYATVPLLPALSDSFHVSSAAAAWRSEERRVGNEGRGGGGGGALSVEWV